MNQSTEKSSHFDFTEVVAVVWRRKWLIMVPLVLVTVVTLVGSYMMTPMFESSVIIRVANPVKLSLELQRLLGDARQGYQTQQDRRLELRSLQNEITSTPYISQLVRNLRLDENPELEKAARKMQASSPRLSLDSIKFDILLAGLRNKIGVAFVGNDQIRITAQSTDPFRARNIAKTLGEVFISEKMKQELGTVRISQDFSLEQLARYENDLQEMINEKTEFEREMNKIQLNEAVTSDENRRDIQSEINNTRMEIEDKKEEERRMLSDLSGTIENPPKKLDESDVLKNLKSQIDNHLGSIANLMLRYNWSAPEILNHKARLFNLVQDVEDEITELIDRQFGEYDASARRSLVQLFITRAELDVLYSRVNSLQLALDDLNSKVDMIPEYQARLDQLEREVVAARDLRDKFQAQMEGSQISQELVRKSKYSVVEPAKVPLAPFKPKRMQIVVLGFLLGLAIGAAAALITEILDKSFRKIEDVEEALGFPVIGVIPQIDAVRKLKIRK
jgi:uncharacterized protein involved in exopolysaccharide biosynthesis